MGSTAIEIVNEAYRKHNLDEVSSFSTTQEFPGNIAKDTINDVIRFANKTGPYWFTETRTSIPYSVGVYTYSLSTLQLNPREIRYLRKEAVDHYGELEAVNHREFLARWRRDAIQTAEPTAWTRFGNTLELNTIPNQNYSLYAYHYADMPVVSATTDTFLIPIADEDVLIESVHLFLGARIGKWSKEQAEGGIQRLFAPFIAEAMKDQAMPVQMPAAF